MSKRARQKRVSPYRQRTVDPMGGMRLLSHRQPMSSDQLTELGLGYWLAFDNMLFHESTEYDWNIVTGSLNIAIVMAENDIRPDSMGLFKRALDASFSAKLRGEATGVWRYSGADIDTIRSALQIHDRQCAQVTQGVMVRTIQDVQQRVDQGHVYAA